MKKFTIKNIRDWGPCYDPIKYLSEDWEGTAVDILQRQDIPHEDRLWVVLRTDLVSEKLMRLFAIWCARESAKFVLDSELPKFLEICQVIEDYANGIATDAARGAAWGAAWGAARGAAWDSATDAARDAAWYAAIDAATDAAWDAARDVARDAARDSAIDAATDAAWDAAIDAARGAQIKKLIEMIEAENKKEAK